MTDSIEIVFGVILFFAGVTAGLFLSPSGVAVDQFDRICYQEVGPDYTYKQESAQYWNQTLEINCLNPAQNFTAENKYEKVQLQVRPQNE